MEGGVTPYSSSMAPSGSYILIIVSQPVSDEHKQLILDRLNKGLLSWDVDSTGCDLTGLETVCSSISSKRLNDSDVLIQYSTESLGVEVLVSPTVSTLKQCVKNLFSTSTGHKQLIHAGYTFAGSGSWVLQNGTFSFDEFLDIFQQADVQSQKRCNINVHCSEVGPWNSVSFSKDIFTKIANVSFNPSGKVSNVPGSEHLIDCLNRVLSSQALEEIMEASTLVGNIRFNRPTLYMFPAGQGDCALFGINGFNMLIDGGFSRKPCSWEFIRHLDRLDAVLVTRLCENNVCGMSTLMKRKSLNNTYPQIGYVFCNIAEDSVSSTNEIMKAKDDLTISVVGEGHNFIQTLNELKLKPHQCWRDSSVEPFVLYHKVGHGTLEMHVLSPPKDSKEMKDFISEWSSYKETFSSIKSGLKAKSLENAIPLSHATSICAVLIWRPADPKDTITRILFPGSAPQSKIFESLEKLKTLDILKQPVVTKASLSTVAVTKSVSKVEKSVSRASLPNRKNTASPALSVSSVASRNGDVGGVKKEVKKVIKEVKRDNKDIVKKEVKKDSRKDTAAVKKTDSIIKRDASIKKDAASKEVKKLVKKDVKASVEKKEVKSAPKKLESTANKSVGEIKKTTATAVKKTTTTAAKKDAAKTSHLKTNEARKSAPSKLSEPKAAKDVSNKKVAEAKAVPKTKPKPANAAPKTSTPKPKPPSVPKPGSKMTKAVAASSIVASAVAVTVAAFELNEKKEEMVDDIEPENASEKEPEAAEDVKETVAAEKSEEVNVSPLPPEALSPTPSESISLTPSDTLSSAPLETVSPTPPLANEPMSIEEKEVNEIKDIEQDLEVYEAEVPEEEAQGTLGTEETHEKPTDDVNDIELELAKRQKNDDVMSMSFVGLQDENESPAGVEEVIAKTEAAPEQFSINSQIIESEPVEKFDEDKETESIKLTETVEKIEEKVSEEIESEKLVEAAHKDFDNIEEVKEKDIDDQLAHLSMEGSFCAGRASYEQENVAISQMEEVNVKEEAIDNYESEKQENIQVENEREDIQMEEKQDIQDEKEQQDIQVKNLVAGNEQSEFDENDQNKDIGSVDMPQEVDPTYNNIEMSVDNKFEENQFSEEQDNFADEVQEKEVIFEKCEKEDAFSVATEVVHDNKYLEDQEYESQLHVQRIEASLNHRLSNQDYDIAQNIIDDAEMQETSVDEPEEIVRKESAVSIILNDEEPGASYEDGFRRKSCTESEDDVDIQNYMAADRRDSFDQDKLGIRRGSDSDDEDVVKSPTPHAVVDYEGSFDDAMKTAGIPSEDKSDLQQKDVAYVTEKDDFDEKERDSAEDQEDVSDGEMIRHPTPPEMKYSEEEMRDPIGQHYITAPGMKSQVSGITEQPLYEESEDVGSDGSVSPVIEQPVFGNVVQADFPELVTVSGGTTPSEPQSPKTAFGANKFASENAVMDALSEHDCSESSAHSPLYHEGNTFEMPGAEDALDTQTLEAEQKIPEIELDIKSADHVQTAASKMDEDTIPEDYSATAGKEQTFHDKKDFCNAENDAPSDEESYSQNEQSETRSEKSDGADEKSDIHRDDKSDNQHDGKSDVMDDDQMERSDMNDDDRPDSHDDKQDDYGGKGAGDYDVQEGTRSHGLNNQQYDIDEASDNEMQYERYEIKDDFHSSNVIETQSDFNIKESTGMLDNKFVEENSTFAQQLYEGNKSSADFPTEVSDTKATIVQEPDMFGTDDIDVGYEGSDKATYDEVSQQENSKIFSDEVPANFNIPSGFEDIEKTDILDNYTSNLHTSDATELRSSPCGPVDFGDNVAEGTRASPSFPLRTGHCEEPIFGTSDEPLENDETIGGYEGDVAKHTIENRKTADVDDYGRDEIGMMHQNEFETAKQAVFQEELPAIVADDFPVTSAPGAFALAESADHVDITSHHIENFSNYENKSLTEMTEARQYEPLSKYEENIHTSNLAYNESSLITNVVSHEPDTIVSPIPVAGGTTVAGDTNFNLPEASEFATSGMHDEGATVLKNQHTTYEESVSVETKYATDFDTRPDMASNEFEGNKYGYSALSFPGGMQGFEESKFTDPEIVEQSTREESYGDSTAALTSETKTEYHQRFEAQDISGHDSALVSEVEPVSAFGAMNGNDQASWSSSMSECKTQYVTETPLTEAHTAYEARSEQETNYIINSRFQSDSPEDNIMRSDSSPDVPPYPVDSAGQLTDLKHLVCDETQSLNQTKADYPNMNLPNVGVAPLSPNKLLNANRDHSYPASSEDEDSSSIPGTVSPYAYTNKAYAKEEEDIDGNHIYKESIATEKTSEILKEFDGNNPPIMTQMNYSQGYPETQYSGETNYDFRLEEWGKPMGLPTPPDSTQKTVKKTDKPGMKALSRSAADTNGKAYSPSVASKLSSPLKKPKPKATKEPSSSPVYVDLAYVPHHGDPQYCDVEYFKKIRARYYVFSGINPSKEVLNALLEAKKSWKEDLEVTIIPTYETDTLGYWMAQNQDDLAEYSIEVAPSASRCTVNLQDHETSCAAYRLEF